MLGCIWKPPSSDDDDQELMVEPPQQQQSLPATDRGRTKPRRWWVKAALALAFWTGLGLLFSIQVYLLWPDRVTPLRAMQMTMPRWYVWGLLASLTFAADHRVFVRLPLSKRILAHIPLGVLFSFAAMTLDYAVQNVLQIAWRPTSAAHFFLQNFFGQATVYAVIVGASLATGYAAEARKREQEAAELALHSAQLETHLTEARLRVLQSQLNPHFLFNTFNTISALTETDPKMARRMMARLGALLRSSLDHAGRQEVTLAEELRFLDDYLTIERLRFEDRLTVDVRVEDSVRDALVPSFVLQPFVENAIRHGTGALLRTGSVRLSACRAGDRLMLEVEDDGVGLPEGWRLEDHAGVGLSNIARRLEELYGSEHKFVVGNRAGGGVRVEVALPFRREAQAAAAARSQAADAP
ncbi:MAG: sensor histidine kinase [Bryobacteraceae bacterium]